MNYLFRILCGFSLLIFLIEPPAAAQTPTSFPDDDTFLEAFTAYVNKSKRTESIDASSRFSEAYRALDAGQQSAIRATASAMLEKKVRNYPVFTTYAGLVAEIAADPAIPREHITVLRDLVQAAKPSAYKQFEDYMDYLPDLFSSRALYKTGTRLWAFAEGMAYTLSVVDGRAAIHFSKADISGMTKTDTVTLAGTSGTCFPVDNEWQGSGGRLLFTRAGFGPDEAFADLGDYAFSLKSSDFAFDSAWFSMPAHLSGRVLGRVEEKLFSTSPQVVSYPRFESYALGLAIDNIDERLSTSGGFALQGSRMIIRGTRDQFARLTLATEGRKQVSVEARRFLVDTEAGELIADDASVIVYLKRDSIVHPSLIFKYFTNDNTVSLQRSEGIASNLPFKSGYHQMDLNFNELKWNLDSPSIDIRTISTYTKIPVTFTSYDHYVPGGEMQYQTLTGRNTLEMVRDLADSYGTMNFSGEALAGMMGYPLKEVEPVLYRLTKDGFIYYDPESKEVQVDYKTFHYIDAGRGNIDFDHVQFVSDPKGSTLNGTILIDSQAIEIKGVDGFDLSRRKRVTLTPRDKSVTLLEDRDLAMEGKLSAGKLDFKGKGMYFDYRDFKVDMQSVDSLVIYIKGKEMDHTGKYPDLALKSVISNIKGTLFVDDPGNKSGREDYGEYPYFESYDTAYVFFDDNYDSLTFPRDEFYFEVYPFTLDSITRAITDSLTFAGRLLSADIFTPFETRLSVQKDRTLGIDEHTPAEGLALYKGAGRFYENFRLVNEGLFGKGLIEYRQARMRSEKFALNRDSVYARLDTFNMVASEADDVPQVSLGNSVAEWLPYKDELRVFSTHKANSMYNGNLLFDGNLLYREGALTGTSDSGQVSVFRLEGARIESETAGFSKDMFRTEGARLALINKDIKGDLLTVDPVEVEIDFAAREGRFITPSDSVITRIPGTELITDIRNYTWNMSDNLVTFYNNEQGDYLFTSTLPAYDSLQFNAQTAVYDLVASELVASEVNEIALADSRVVPAGKRLTIEQGGRIEPLQDAVLVLNREEAYHEIEGAYLQITSRNDFSGNGQYLYQGATGNPYTVTIDEITVKPDTLATGKKKVTDSDITHIVTARGVIPEEDGFRLDEQLFYKGNVFLYSNNKDIEFEGFARLDLKQNEQSSWFNLNQGIDPDNFSIGLDSLIDEYRQQVVSGLYISPGELELYSAVFNPKRMEGDPAVYQATGSLYKGENSGEYLFGEESAVKGTDDAGTVMYYNDNTGAITIDGRLDWISRIPLVKADGYGELRYDPVTNTAEAVSAIAIDFPMDDAIWYQLPRDLAEYEEKARTIRYNRPEIKRALKYFIGNEAERQAVIADIEAEGYFQMPASFPYKMLLTDVALKWDPVDGNFKSTGLVGVSSVNRYPVDLQVQAYTEFGYNLGSAYMNLYLETSSGTWYYFSTNRGKMFVLSSDRAFNDAVVNAENKEVRDGKKGDVIYEFLPGNLTGKLTFMARMEDYLARIGQPVAPGE